MPKKSRRERKMLKTKEEKRIAAQKKAGIPYSTHKVRICCHYNAYGGFFLPVKTFSYLRKIKGKDAFVCANCGKVFTLQQTDKIDALCKYFKTTLIKSQSELSELLTEDILPCKYYYTAPKKAEICGTVKVYPRIGGLWAN